MQHEEKIRLRVLEFILDRSASGHLVVFEEIPADLEGQGLIESTEPEHEVHWETMLERVLDENQDVRVIIGENGRRYYYSSRSMTGAYAAILARKTEDPRLLIADTVRENSRVYPRPVRVFDFAEPPFELSRETILQCMESLGVGSEYEDIRQTTTSAGTVFFYSTRHLDTDYAAMLAEWTDVGQAGSP